MGKKKDEAVSTVYECIKTCIHDGRQWEAGPDQKTLRWPDDKVVPCVDPQCTAKTRADEDVPTCRKCSGTGRSMPPHHFRPIEKADEPERGDTFIKDEADVKKVDDEVRTKAKADAKAKAIAEVEASEG